MGLDLYTTTRVQGEDFEDENPERGRHQPVGSYGGVHVLRRALIRAFVSWARANGRADDAARVERWLSSAERTGIDYGRIEEYADETSDPRRSDLEIGLWKFVHHSDCDGFHSRGDVLDVAQMLRVLVPLVPDDDFSSQRAHQLASYYEAAAVAQQRVLFRWPTTPPPASTRIGSPLPIRRFRWSRSRCWSRACGSGCSRGAALRRSPRRTCGR